MEKTIRSKGNNKMNLSKFIGRQLSRLKTGQTYYMIIISTISTLGILNIAFPNIDTWIFIILLPILLLFGAFLIGYLMDKSNVRTMEFHKSVEMNQRYLTIIDFKNNDFRILQMEVLFNWMDSFKNNKPLDSNLLKEKYKTFIEKWSKTKE